MVSACAIQIVSLENHEFELHSKKLKKILDNRHLKNREIVTVSVAGAFRKGKSFLVNFFLKYLYAQYKKHDISDWIGENSPNNELKGFKSRGGPKRETTGIWVWSDIFTHDFDNGDKVAIIVMDTQGIFDDRSSVKDCTTIFTISMMLSSVQCYNVMQNIQEDDLQNLQLFAEYGRLASTQPTEKPFQSLLFIVRDWFHASHYDYGYRREFIDEKLGENDEQTPEMLQLRARIRESFDNISAFLMPFPGSAVAEGKFDNVSMEQIEEKFIKSMEELVPTLFAPENLIVKTINGQKIRARDLITYLETYVNIFNSGALPEPKTVFRATADANNQILHSECLKSYDESMENSLRAVSYFTESALQETHNKAKQSSVAQFQKQRKLGDDKLISSFQQKLENEIENKFKSYKMMNKRQHEDFIAKEKAEKEARRQAQLVAEAKEKERIALDKAMREAELRAKADEREKIANEKAEREAALRAEAEERAKIAIENAKREAELRTDTEEKIAQENAQREAEEEARIKSQEEKRLKCCLCFF